MPLYEFYGDTCPHCKEMEPLIAKLQKEGVKIETLEVWNNKENVKKMEEHNKSRCPGVPFFINTETDQWICGSTDEETLRKWAAGEQLEH